MKKYLYAMMPVAAAFALVLSFGGGAAAAQSAGGTTYTADLQPVPLNTPSGAASGKFTLTLNGNQATVHETVTGLAATIPTDPATLKAVNIPASLAGKPFPHVQHIHINGAEACPTPTADANGDGALSTVEGQPAYGMIGTTLSTGAAATDGSTATDVTVAPSGGSFTYDRTFTLNADTMAALKSGKAAVVVHGLDPATAPKATVSTPNSLKLVLPGETNPVALLATAPALCGVVHVSASAPQSSTAPQMSAVPQGGAGTGGGSTSGLQDEALFGFGALMLAGAVVVLIARQRTASQS